MSGLDDLSDELYGVDPDLFMDARTAAVAAVRASGDKLLAKQVASLRKPTRSAWLVNQLARSHPERLAALSDLAERLVKATVAMDVEALRTAGAQRTGLVGELTKLAVEEGRGRGYDGGESVRAEVSTTLQAALADPEVLTKVLAGRLEKAQVYAGFGFALPSPAAAPVVTLTPAPPLPAPADAGPSEADLERERARRVEIERLTAALATAVEARATAEEAEEQARLVLDRASQEVADLRGELAAAEAAELAARDAANAASVELHDARTAEQQTQAALDGALRDANREH